MTDRAIIMRITRAGLKAVFDATSTGFKLQLSHMAIGTGGGAGYVPSGFETALRTEFQRVGIGGGDYLTDFEILVQALFDGETQGWVHEMGLFATPESPSDAPILFALWSEINAPLAYKTNGVPFLAAATLALSEIPPNSITLVVGGASVNILLGEPFARISAEIIRLQRRAVETEIARFTPIIQSINF